MAYQSSPMRTTASVWPSTTNWRAAPGATSATAQTRWLGHARPPSVAALEALGDAGPQRGDHVGDGQLVEHLVEEAGHHQPLGHLGGTPRLSR